MGAENDKSPKQSVKADKSGSNLANYCESRRKELNLSQEKLAKLAGIKNQQTIGRIERNQTTRVSSKTKSGLAKVFGITEEYLDELILGRDPRELETLKICPNCWQPGTIPENAWLDIRAKYCFLCGGSLIDRCSKCGNKIGDFKHHFCPFCGQPYKLKSHKDSIE